MSWLINEVFMRLHLQHLFFIKILFKKVIFIILYLIVIAVWRLFSLYVITFNLFCYFLFVISVLFFFSFQHARGWLSITLMLPRNFVVVRSLMDHWKYIFVEDVCPINWFTLIFKISLNHLHTEIKNWYIVELC